MKENDLYFNNLIPINLKCYNFVFITKIKFVILKADFGFSYFRMLIIFRFVKISFITFSFIKISVIIFSFIRSIVIINHQFTFIRNYVDLIFNLNFELNIVLKKGPS